MVWAVVSAVPGAHTAVVNLPVQPFVGAIRGEHRAHRLARRHLAVLAEHRQEHVLRVIGRAFGPPLDTEPRDLPAIRRLRLADDRHVVLGVAGDRARLAPDARVDVHGHAPAVVRIVLGRIHPDRLELPLLAAKRLLARGLQIHVLRDLALLLVVGRLQHRERTPRAGLRDARAHGQVRHAARCAVGSRGKQRDRVHRRGRRLDIRPGLPRAEPAGNEVIGRVPVADRNRDRVRRDRRRRIRRQLDRSLRRLHADDVAPCDPELRGIRRRDLDPRVPRRLRHRVRNLLQPGRGGTPAVVEAQRRIGEQRESAVAVELRRRGIDRRHLRRDRDRRHVLEHPALLKRDLEVRPDRRFPRRLHVLLEGRPRERALALFRPEDGAGQRQKGGPPRPRIPDRVHRRLHEPEDALARRVVAPRFEPVRIGEDDVGQRRRLVGQARETDHEAHFACGVGELEAARQREGRIHARSEQQELDLAVRHRLRQRGDVRVRRHLSEGRIRAESHRFPDVARCRVQQVDRGERGHRVAARRGDTAADRERGPRTAEHLGDLDELPNRNAAGLGRLLHVDLRHRVRELPVRGAGLDQDFENCEGHQSLGARRVPDPFVGARCRDRLPGLHVDERPGAAIAERVHAGEAARVPDAREPRLEEIRAEGEEHLRFLERVVRNGVAPERHAVRGAERFVPEWLERHPGPRADRLREPIEQRAETPRLELRHERDRPALARLTKRRDLLGDDLQRVVPADRRDGAALPSLRSGEAVRVIQPLKRRVPSRAERALIHRMIGIALQLHHAAIAVSRNHAAPAGTLATDGREPAGDSRHHLLVRHHQRQDALGRRTTPRGGRRGGRRDDLEEVAPIHRISDGTSRSRAARACRGCGSARGDIRCTIPSRAAARSV